MLKFKKMGSDKVPLLLITANVGSIFEDPSVMLSIWTSEFLAAVAKMDPKFIALHLQEVGGKTYEKSMQYVQDFVQRLCDCPELRLFDKIRIYLDEDFSSPEKFTALGNMYFVHSSLSDVRIWDFDAKAYVNVEGKEVHSGNIEKVPTKEKAKFPQQFFPECKWSRKGFLRTRWSLRGTCVEFVNIHLFHDASNLLALEAFPSVYCRSRRRALRHTLRHLHADVNAAPYFIFGDFNFRTDTGGVVKKMTEDLKACRLQNGNLECHKMQFRGADDELVLTVGKKEFSHSDHQTVFREPWLQRYDRELEALRSHLYEYPIKFGPSYPFEEDVEQPTHYMKTRCPSWCDRVLLSQTARLLVQHQEAARPSENKHLHMSRKSIAESTDSSGRASSSDSSPARSASPSQQNYQSPNKSREQKSSVSDIDGLAVPGINVSRKSIADPTGIQHAVNSRVCESDGSPVRRRLVRNQSEGSPKPGDPGFSSELRRLVDAPAHRKRPEYGVIGENTCMGDHKPIYLRVMLQSDRGTLQCCPGSYACTLCNDPSKLPSTLSLLHSNRLIRIPTDPEIYKLEKKIKHAKPLTSELNIKNRLLTDKDRLLIDKNSFLSDKNRFIIDKNKLIFDDRRLTEAEKNVTDVNNFLNDKNKFLIDGNYMTDDKYVKRNRAFSLGEVKINIPDVEITSVEYESFDKIFVNEIDTALLHSAAVCLDPYTPESVDSCSPNPEICSDVSEDLSSENMDLIGPSLDGNIEERHRFKLTRDRSVSPTQLKTRLEVLLTSEKDKYSKEKSIPELQRMNSRDSAKSRDSANSFCCLVLKCYGFCREKACVCESYAPKCDVSKCCNN